MIRTLLFILLLAVPSFASDLVRRDGGNVIVETNHCHITIDLAHGASATSFIVKPSGEEMLLPDATHNAGLFADVFRDGGFDSQWRGAYEARIVSPGVVVFERHGVGAGPVGQVTLSKTLSVKADSPVIDVSVEIRMADGEHRHFPFRYGAHNRIGREKPGVMQYFMPSIKGVQTFNFSASEQSGSQQHTVTDPSHPWLAVTTESNQGMAFHFAEPHPGTLYSYTKNRIATVEWGFEQYILRRGQTWKSSYTIQTFSGLPRVDGVFESAAGAIVTAEDSPTHGHVLISGTTGACEVHVSYCRLPDRTWKPLSDTKVNITYGSPLKLPYSIPTTGDGSYVVKATLHRDDQIVGEFERLVEIGKPSGRYIVMPANPKTDILGATTRDGAIAINPDEPVLVEKVMPLDSRLVRGFVHAPVDGRIDTRNSDGGINEWMGAGGLQNINYSEFNQNQGIHITLPDGGFDAIIARGGWRGKVYRDREDLMPPSADVPAFIDMESKLGVYRQQFSSRVTTKRLSFFAARERGEPLADVTFLRVKRGADITGASEQSTYVVGDLYQPDDMVHRAMEGRYSPFYRAHELNPSAGQAVSLLKGEFIHLFAPAENTTDGIGAVSVELDLTAVEPGAMLTIRVQDVLDPRREVMGVDFQVAGPGRYIVRLDTPDQVFLPPRSEWTNQPRIDGEFTPRPKVWLSLAFDAPASIGHSAVTLHHVPRKQALQQAGAWRKFLLKGLFSTMTEPRPWMNLTDDKPVRQQISEKNALKRYRSSLTEVLETVEIARQLLPEDDIVRQYHEWIFQNLDRRKPLPAPVLPAEVGKSGAPRWAALVRQSWIEQRDMVEWWLANRMVPGGLFGGGINDDTDLFQTWQCLPLIESEPLGARLKDAAAQLADNAWHRTLEEGINRRSLDALHAYEEGVNQLALCARWFYGDPVHFERLMICADSTMKLMVETPDGRVHFGGHTLGIDQVRNGFETLGSAGGYATKLFLHPLYEVAWYNRNPAVLKRFTQWGRTWQGYQQPGAYAEYVDIKTGQPKQITEAARTPTDEWLALYQITGDRSWFDPLVISMQSQSYRGFGPSYGRSAHALVTWDEKHQSQFREIYNGPGSGYAGFVVNQDRELLMRWLEDSASWFGRYRHMYTAAEQKTDRLLTYNASTPIACYLGDAPNRNRWVNFTAVSYEGLRGEDFAALVWDAGNNRLKIAIYNFTDQTLTGNLRTWRLDHGRYQVRIGTDTNDDGTIDAVTNEREQILLRGSSLPVQLSPKKITVITVTQLQQLDDIHTRSDLALSAMETKVEGGNVTGVVHNIGAAAADVVVAVVDEDDKVVATQTLGNLEAPLDLKPRRLPFTMNLPDGVRNGLRLVVDPTSQVAEINEMNNAVLLESR